MTMLDTLLRPQAANLINMFGRDVSYQRWTSEAAFTVTTMTQGTEVYSTSTVKAVAIQPELASVKGKHLEEGEAVELAAEWTLYIAASTLGFEPSAEDRVTLDSVLYEVVQIKTYQSGALPALYELTLVRSP